MSTTPADGTRLFPRETELAGLRRHRSGTFATQQDRPEQASSACSEAEPVRVVPLRPLTPESGANAKLRIGMFGFTGARRVAEELGEHGCSPTFLASIDELLGALSAHDCFLLRVREPTEARELLLEFWLRRYDGPVIVASPPWSNRAAAALLDAGASDLVTEPLDWTYVLARFRRELSRGAPPTRIALGHAGIAPRALAPVLVLATARDSDAVFLTNASALGFTSIRSRTFRDTADVLAPNASLLVLRPFGEPKAPSPANQCAQLRRTFGGLVLYLGASDSYDERLGALRAGATAALSASASKEEVRTNVESMLRVVFAGSDQRLRHGELEVDLARREVSVRGSVCAVGDLEYELLVHLLRNAGRTVTLRETSALLGCSPDERAVRKYYEHLRSKLGSAASIIQTVRGRGYRAKPAQGER